MTAPKKVVLVEDSAVALSILQKLIDSDPEVDVVGTARDGIEGLEVIRKTQPDVVCTDLIMENMDGLELTKHVMAYDPRPILVISNFVQKTDIDNIFSLLQAGAVDVFPKPTTGSPTDYERLKVALITKIKVLSSIKLAAKLPLPVRTVPLLAPSSLKKIPELTSDLKAIAIGGSTGSLTAIQKICQQLPINFPLPAICILHISEGMLSALVDWLSGECALRVKIASPGELPAPGTVYFAPETHHLELDDQGKFIYTRAAVTDKYCPSITVTFKAIANFYGKFAAGILLSGIGNDGAQGLQAISQTGGTTIAQDEKSSVVFGMVKEAIALDAVQQVLAIDRIVPFLSERLVFK